MVTINRSEHISRSPICQYPKARKITLPDNSIDGAGFRDRLFLAWSLWQGRHGRKLTQAELGQMIGQVGGERFAQNTISGWFRDVVPSVHDTEYLAKALECDPGWLAFGPASEAPGPSDPVRERTQPMPPPTTP